MKIGVNSRIIQGSDSGIPRYITNLYKTLEKEFPSNSYLYFQTKKNKTIGLTQTLPTLPGLIGIMMFDLITVSFLIIKNRVNVYHGPANILPIFKIPHVKYVLTIHDLSFKTHKEYYPLAFRLYYNFFIRLSIHNADIILADSENTRLDIEHYFKNAKTKIFVNLLGSDHLDLYKPKLPKFIEKNEPFFFTMTTHPKRKNTYGIIEAIATSEQLKKITFIIVGTIDINEKIKLENFINKYNLQNIKIGGFVTNEELSYLYKHCISFLYPSFYEGFGIPVLEAALYRCLVVTSKSSSLPEVIKNHSLLVNPFDIHDIATKTTKVLSLSSKERNTILDQNEKFAKEFTWINTAKKFISILEIETR